MTSSYLIFKEVVFFLSSLMRFSSGVDLLLVSYCSEEENINAYAGEEILIYLGVLYLQDIRKVI